MGAHEPTQLEIRLLGSFQVKRDGAVLRGKVWGRRKTQELLKFLVAHRGQVFTQEQLIEVLYDPEADPDALVRNLLGRISELRHALEPDLTNGRHSHYIPRPAQATYAFSTDAPCWIDVENFFAKAENGDRFVRQGLWSDA